MQLTISLAQFDLELGEPAVNLQKADDLAAAASRCGSNLLLLPELWSTGYDLNRAAEFASAPGEGMHAAMADLARRYRLHVCGSVLTRLPSGKIGNTAALFDPQGTMLAQYTKLHLFRPMAEDRHLESGDAVAVVDTTWGKTGLAICYDLRFPELFRIHALHGARLVLLVAEWPQPRLMHWQTLLRARAIENQLFVAACNRVGTSNGSHFFGHSCIIDPWGETIVESSDEEVLLTATIDLARVDEVRQILPVLEDRREDVY
jgi:omega-amidase